MSRVLTELEIVQNPALGAYALWRFGVGFQSDDGIDAATSAWQTEAQGWLRQAIELGLLSSEQVIPADWPSIIDLMRQLAARHARNARPSLAGIDVALARLESLRRDETQAAAKLTEHRQRMNELRRLRESSDAYGGSMHINETGWRSQTGCGAWSRPTRMIPSSSSAKEGAMTC